MDVRECRVRINKMRQLVACGIGNRRLERFLNPGKWVEESGEFKNRDGQGTDARGRCSLCI